VTDWTNADEQQLKLSLSKAVLWLGQITYRGHCLVCEKQHGHEDNCALVAVMTKLGNIREEERLATVNAASRRARQRQVAQNLWRAKA
jgi:hypothetical protein